MSKSSQAFFLPRKACVMDQSQPEVQPDSDLLPMPSLGEDQSDLQPDQSDWQLLPSVSKNSSEVNPESSVVKDDFRVEDTQEFQSDNTELAEVREQQLTLDCLDYAVNIPLICSCLHDLDLDVEPARPAGL
ncbi:UNVERIFIED_CONTAM: hypothetical protein K2H54_040062 [Gekko kuhli]